MSDSDDDCYGPVLPPSMRKTSTKENTEKKKQDDSSDDDAYGPALPPSMRKPSQTTSKDKPSSSSESKSTIGPTIGPSLPPSSANRSSSAAAADDASSSDDDAYGPALPPGFVKRPSGPAVRGPAAPGPAVRGPALPPGGLPAQEDGEEDEDEDVIGPRPPAESADLGRYAAAEVERRATSMKEKLDAMGRPAELVREEWMLELPPDRAGEFGLGPRQFRKTTPQERGDTSGWTETPSTKGQSRPAPTEKAAKKGGELVELATRRRDERMAQVAEDLGAKRNESLLDMHQKNVKKAKAAVEAGEAPKRRQEFDRDRDLGTNRFDDAQRAAAIKRSRGAADMFSSGAQKFL
ncbi:GPALPP motifs-containing protein 1-like isoform X1 [Amphibalanus amphitrite]|uniref:GPALPP motifs-containing protein 1-like isoform X1 n=1 Tax=Amphibalanus amphitrite TaxID=1232801 RepID=UPI001C90B740|nr:GPALPP motifs-containing protein 1-like isoform X1 [Amphibalanus amphitrite]